jgi:DNA-binding NarL/FixJ family response regulator
MHMVKTERRILIVDDHAVVREGLRGLIEREPDLAVAGEAATVADALSACDEGACDGVVLDLALGNESGLELLERIRSRHPALPILVLSMHSESLYAERALRSGANGYVMKHEATSQLLAALRQVLAGNMFASQMVMDRMLRSLSSKTPQEQGRGVDSLTNREIEVFRLLGQGLGTSQIASHLHISHKTVETHRARIKEKLGLETANELVVRAAMWVNESAPQWHEAALR